MLVNSKQILLEAKKGHYAVPAPDFLDLDSARTYVQVAEKLGKPVILSFAQIHKDTISLEEAAVIGKFLGERASVPVVLHLDHGQDMDYVRRAVELGFTSVMLDASMDPFDENVRKTKEAVELAHAHNITVEAEMGHVGQGANYINYDESDSVYTSVEEAREFVHLTNVDSLAVSIGTAHGVYKGNGKPVLNFERLQQLQEALDVPLVLHGGSGTGEDNLRRCASGGICKLNLFTDFLLSAMAQLEATPPADYFQLKKLSNQAMAAKLEEYYGICRGLLK